MRIENVGRGKLEDRMFSFQNILSRLVYSRDCYFLPLGISMNINKYEMIMS